MVTPPRLLPSLATIVHDPVPEPEKDRLTDQVVPPVLVAAKLVDVPP